MSLAIELWQGAFRAAYRRVFAALGHPVGETDALSDSELARAESTHGVRLPEALREFYGVAGNERRLNHAFNRLLAPSDWEIHRGKLVFMAENQGVVGWGVTVAATPGADPGVFQAAAVKGALDEWHLEHSHCSVFLIVMLHWQATFGCGMPCHGSGLASPDLNARLERDWTFVGEVNEMFAHHREGQAITVLPWKDFRGQPERRVFAGATERARLEAIESDLALRWDRARC